VRASDIYFRGSSTFSHAPGDPGGISTHSSVHRGSSLSTSAAGGGFSCPGRQKLTQSGISTPGTHGIGMRRQRCCAAAKASGDPPAPSEGWQIGTHAGSAGTGPGSNWAFVSGCGSWPGRQIGVQPGSVGAGSARARGSPPAGLGMQICGSSAGGNVGSGQTPRNRSIARTNAYIVRSGDRGSERPRPWVSGFPPVEANFASNRDFRPCPRCEGRVIVTDREALHIDRLEDLRPEPSRCVAHAGAPAPPPEGYATR
jgi:hypothetical protein